MYKIQVNNKYNFLIESTNTTNEKKTNNKSALWDLVEIKSGCLHIIKDNKSYSAEVVKADYAEKSFVIKVNGAKYTISVKDKFDDLLQSLGMENMNSSKVNEVKAPMPGLVLEVKVNEGATVKKGDAIIVLEAMKMENILKSPTDGLIKKINVKKGAAVEKNQVLLQFG